MSIIGHLDMDAFFAAVEERDKPHLRGKPIVVGSDPAEGRGRGVVATANYVARQFGIHSAMPITQAWQLAETARRKGALETIWITPRGGRYGEVSRRIMAIISEFVPEFEQTSVDEAYLELSFTESYERAGEICKKIKEAIREKESLTASMGIGPNKLIAKIASDWEKPDGFTVVEEKDAEKFIEPLPIRRIPGVGPKTEIFLRARNIRIIKDAKNMTQAELAELLGKSGADLYWRVRGVDHAPIRSDYETKSLGEQETFDRDTLDAAVLSGRLKMICQNVTRELSNNGFRQFGRVVLTVRFSNFETKTRSRTLLNSMRTASELEFEMWKLFLPFLDDRENPGRRLIRLLGVRVEKLA
jgi:DNA polymerase IV (archaeal DinB-like DNA polymerase)